VTIKAIESGIGSPGVATLRCPPSGNALPTSRSAGNCAEMNCLPIVGRELRVAARKRSTFWLRIAAAITGLMLGTGCLVLGNLQRTGTAQMGGMLFSLLTWLCLASALSAGLFFTSDALSEEKREGTLGLLFLTDLRGYDVASGKLLATSLRGFYALLAVLPILAVTLLMGGITGSQYWKSSLALVNSLFFSLAAGMLISAVSRDSQKALAGTLFLTLLLAVGGPLADGITAGVKKRGFEAFWSLSSPGYVLATAGSWGRSAYWEALLINQVLGWGMFALACVLVPHTWQERKRAGSSDSGSTTYWFKYGSRHRRERRRRTLLDRDPMAWLASREIWQSLGLWTIALLVTVAFAFVLIKRAPMESWIIWNYLGGLFALFLYLCAASVACRFLIDARRSGLIELLLASPLSEKQIVRGQWRALLRLFGLPVLLLLTVHIAGATFSQISFLRITTQAGAAMTAAATNQSRTFTNGTGTLTTTVTIAGAPTTNATFVSTSPQKPVLGRQIATAAVAAASAALCTGANLVALIWFGMWMGLTSTTANLATLKTLLFVQIIPWFVMAFSTSMLIGVLLATAGARFSGGNFGWFSWWPLLSTVIGTALAAGKDLAFILWSRKKLYSAFREQAVRNPAQPRIDVPPIATPVGQ
jgi:hypothetical protein